MDSAYDPPEIWDKSRAPGHVPVIDADHIAVVYG
jgi:hypothetical protein